MALEYPVTKEFPSHGIWRFFALAVYIFMALCVVVLVILNVAAVGYELEPYYGEIFNPPQDLWWARLTNTGVVKGRADCEQRRIDLRDTFKTKLNMFQYTVDSLAYTSQINNLTAPRPTSFSYNGSILRDCTFSYMSISINQVESTTTMKPHVTCFTDELVKDVRRDTLQEIQLNISSSLVMSPDRDKDTVYSRFLSEGGTFSSVLYSHPTISPVLLTLMGLSVDVLNVMYVPRLASAINGSLPNTRHRSYRYTPRAGRNWNWTEEWFYQSFGSGDLTPFALETNTTLAVLQNLFVIFSQAVLVDLGSDMALFRDWNALSKSLSPHFNDTEARPVDLRLGWAPAEGSGRFDSPFIPLFLNDSRQFNINLPIPKVQPAVIDTTFFCKRWRPKPASSLLAAVAAATISFVLAIWGGLLAAARFVLDRHSAGRPDDEEKKNSDDQSNPPTETSPPSGQSPPSLLRTVVAATRSLGRLKATARSFAARNPKGEEMQASNNRSNPVAEVLPPSGQTSPSSEKEINP